MDIQLPIWFYLPVLTQKDAGGSHCSVPFTPCFHSTVAGHTSYIQIYRYNRVSYYAIAALVALIGPWGRDKEEFCTSDRPASNFYVHMNESPRDRLK